MTHAVARMRTLRLPPYVRQQLPEPRPSRTSRRRSHHTYQRRSCLPSDRRRRCLHHFVNRPSCRTRPSRAPQS
jgi:hypothetical protein